MLNVYVAAVVSFVLGISAQPTFPSSTSSNAPPGNCMITDAFCWNKLALEYVNGLRAELNDPTILPLVTGSKFMLQNALNYAMILDSNSTRPRPALLHQPIAKDPGLTVGSDHCATRLTGENLAWYLDPSVDNPAFRCVNIAWRNSAGHYANMIRRTFVSVTVAIFTATDNYVFCVQTFANNSPAADSTGDCAPALPKSSSSPTATPSASSSMYSSPSSSSSALANPTVESSVTLSASVSSESPSSEAAASMILPSVSEEPSATISLNPSESMSTESFATPSASSSSSVIVTAEPSLSFSPAPSMVLQNSDTPSTSVPAISPTSSKYLPYRGKRRRGRRNFWKTFYYRRCKRQARLWSRRCRLKYYRRYFCCRRFKFSRRRN